MDGRKIDRSRLFDDDSSHEAFDADKQDLEAFEKIMESRINIQDNQYHQQQQQQEDVNNEEMDCETAEAEEVGVPVFKLFAGSNLVKVETEAVEPEYIAPQRPEAQLEESDSEEHRNALLATAIDVEVIRAMSTIPLPALQYPRRVIHVKADGSVESSASTKHHEKTKSKSKASRKRRRAQVRKRILKKQAVPPPYERCVRSLYTGGLIKGKMLEDVIREEKAAADAMARKSFSGRGGSSAGRGGFRGRGRGSSRGRGGRVGTTGRSVLSAGSQFSK
ncbi:hypothetical protein GGI11_002984 [Coemansia sp. RSA 2049]|nr:hypothetical protein H4217_006888 [Coemansia sp. RSA 1939]KAJ2518027.1 hypothetical protein GGI11_002984 [Coemansia sp. RSA 2049]KAJ2690019.1 hypothetical protein GGH99_002707 [Coemansia sp. RSA 1285]